MGAIFVSYSRDCAALVDNLANDIKALGYSPWFDQELSGGQDWWNQILATVRACDVFVFALTPESVGSVACTREYSYAAALGKPILPVLLSGIATNLLPPALAQIQHVDYRSQDRKAVLRLARAIKELLPAGSLPDPLPPLPAVPTSYLGGLGEQISNPSLSFPEQAALLIHLKRGLSENETAVDARELLTRLRKRPDVYAFIAQDIDSIAAVTPSAQPLTTHKASAAPIHVDTEPDGGNAEAAEPIAQEHTNRERRAAEVREQERLARERARAQSVNDASLASDATAARKPASSLAVSSAQSVDAGEAIESLVSLLVVLALAYAIYALSTVGWRRAIDDPRALLPFRASTPAAANPLKGQTTAQARNGQTTADPSQAIVPVAGRTRVIRVGRPPIRLATPPRTTKHVPPSYFLLPSLTKPSSITIDVTINRDGTVENAVVLAHELRWADFEDAAVAAVKQWQFVPTDVSGEPVRVITTVVVPVTSIRTLSR
jgi:TonB family protein